MLLEHEGYKVVGETDNGCDAIQMVLDTKQKSSYNKKGSCLRFVGS